MRGIFSPEGTGGGFEEGPNETDPVTLDKKFSTVRTAGVLIRMTRDVT